MTAAARVRGALTAPTLPRRMACFVYEALLLFGIGLVPGVVGAVFVAQTGQQHPLQSGAALRVYAYVFYGIYFVYFWSVRGRTLAMQTWHIALTTVDGARPGQWRAAARYLAAGIWFAPAAVLAASLGWPPVRSLAAVTIGVVVYAALALLQRERQFWHDVWCGTRLVDTRSGATAAGRVTPA